MSDDSTKTMWATFGTREAADRVGARDVKAQ